MSKVKCQFHLKSEDVVDHINDAGFYVSFNDGELVLNMKSQDGHKYYHQVKGNLAMTGRKVFNFCMWTLQDMTTVKLGTSQSRIHDHSTGLNVCIIFFWKFQLKKI